MPLIEPGGTVGTLTLPRREQPSGETNSSLDLPELEQMHDKPCKRLREMPENEHVIQPPNRSIGELLTVLAAQVQSNFQLERTNLRVVGIGNCDDEAAHRLGCQRRHPLEVP